jgi:hypothetical protein
VSEPLQGDPRLPLREELFALCTALDLRVFNLRIAWHWVSGCQVGEAAQLKAKIIHLCPALFNFYATCSSAWDIYCETTCS